LDHRVAAPSSERQMVALDRQFGEQVSIHGVGNASAATTLESMENEDFVETSSDNTDIEEELLIEEISIDGMCGVY
jgi:mycofactocin precursor